MSKKKHGGGGGHDAGGMMRWLLTYADMITLLLALFIMLFAISRVDSEKYKAVTAGLSKVFGSGTVIVDTHGGGAGVLPTIGTSNPGTSPADVQAIKDVLEKIGAGLYTDFARDGRFAAYLSERGLTISLAGNAFFDSGKADLKPSMLPLLDAIAQRLKDVPNDISVEGFTDSDPIHTAEFPSNWELSYARANRVRAYLEAQGIAPQRLIVVGYGETRPLYDNTTAENKAKNRRVDVVVLREKQVINRGQEISEPKK